MTFRDLDVVASILPVGATFKWQFTVTDDDGVLIVDSNLTVTATTPDDVEVIHTLVSPSTIVASTTPAGTYNIDYPLIVKGDHYLQILTSTGDVVTIYVPVLL